MEAKRAPAGTSAYRGVSDSHRWLDDGEYAWGSTVGVGGAPAVASSTMEDTAPKPSTPRFERRNVKRDLRTPMDKWEDHVADFHLHPSTPQQVRAIQKADIREEIFRSIRPIPNANLLPENHAVETLSANTTMLYHNMPHNIHEMATLAANGRRTPKRPSTAHHPHEWAGPSSSDPKCKWRTMQSYHSGERYRSTRGASMVKRDNKKTEQPAKMVKSDRSKNPPSDELQATQRQDPITVIASRIAEDRNGMTEHTGHPPQVSPSPRGRRGDKDPFLSPFNTPVAGVLETSDASANATFDVQYASHGAGGSTTHGEAFETRFRDPNVSIVSSEPEFGKAGSVASVGDVSKISTGSIRWAK